MPFLRVSKEELASLIADAVTKHAYNQITPENAEATTEVLNAKKALAEANKAASDAELAVRKTGAPINMTVVISTLGTVTVAALGVMGALWVESLRANTQSDSEDERARLQRESEETRAANQLEAENLRSQNQLKLDDNLSNKKLETELILMAMRATSQEQRIELLSFFLSIGLIDDPERKIRNLVRQSVSIPELPKRVDEQVPTLELLQKHLQLMRGIREGDPCAAGATEKGQTFRQITLPGFVFPVTITSCEVSAFGIRKSGIFVKNETEVNVNFDLAELNLSISIPSRSVAILAPDEDGSRGDLQLKSFDATVGGQLIDVELLWIEGSRYSATISTLD